MKHLFQSFAGLALALFVGLGTPVQAKEIKVRTRPITEFQIGRDTVTFGSLRFVGGLEMTGANPFGSISAFRFLQPGGRFVGVSDRGYWLFGTMERDSLGRPTGVSDVRMDPFERPESQMGNNRKLDAEGLAVMGDVATVSFERTHRVTQYNLTAGGAGTPLRDLDILIPLDELRSNRGLETLMASRRAGAFDGAILALSEMSLNKAGDIFASVLSGPREGIFFVHRSDGFDITDGAFLPDGDILILERRFSYLGDIGMRLRRLSADDVRPGATVDGEVLFQADLGYQIDNMEGLDVWQAADGTTRVSLVSDDNQSILQRNVYLEFIYKPE